MKFGAKKAIAAGLLGGLLGASMVFIANHREREALVQQRNYWQQSANHWHLQWLQLQQEMTRANQRASRSTYVQSVTVSVVRSEVPATAVRSALEPYTSALLGMRMDAIKLSVAYHLFEGRVLIIGASLYRVEVRGILLSPHSELLVKITPITPPKPS